MLIVCPSCATSYDVEPASLQPSGRQVRCVRCRTVWRAEPSQADKLIAAAKGLAPRHGSPKVPLAAVADDVVSAEDGVHAAGETDWTVHLPDGQPADPSFAAPGQAAADGFDPEQADSQGEPSEAVEVEAPPIAPVDLDAGQPAIDVDADQGAGHPEDIETVAARRFRRGAKRSRQVWSLSRLQTMILALIIVDSILVGWRKDIVRILPQTASLYAAMGLSVNLRGLTFDNVATSTDAHEGVPVLVVQGNIVNDSGKVVEVPRLKLVVRNAAKREIYSWTTAPPLARLSAYQAVGFRTRLASPPAGSSDVLVRFLNRRDVVAETR